MSLNSSYKLIETDDIIHILGFYSTFFFAKRKARKMNAGSKTCFNCYSNTIKKWDKATVVAALKKYAAQHNCIPTAHKWQRFRNNPEIPSYTSIINVFGRWNNAIEAAGFEPREPYKLKELSQ